jgi:rhamnopyranosyl-N-acetylglucosaminyl-diphospho-decaprenol beta-1,3/1,4-galactofuranosyltransferase
MPSSRLCAVPGSADVFEIEKGRMHTLSAVIVTYNNSEMLEAVLQDLGLQTMRLHKILLMDNSDNSATRVMVYRKFPSVIHVRMPENVGTAGGFHEGIKRAINDCDFVLTLDDDVRLHPDSVANLYRGYIRLQRQTHRLGAVRAVGLRHEGAAPRRLDTFAWRGTLISVEAIKRVGLPLPDYFMYADDVEYSMRLIKAGYAVFDIPDSKIVEQRTQDKLSKRFFGKTVVCYAEGFRFYYAFRNSVHAYKAHRHHRALARTLGYAIKMMVFWGFSQTAGQSQTLRAIGGGVIDGMRSHLGKNDRYLPGTIQSAPQ